MGLTDDRACRSKDGQEWTVDDLYSSFRNFVWDVRWHGNDMVGVGSGIICGGARFQVLRGRTSRGLTEKIDYRFPHFAPSTSSLVIDGDTAYCLTSRYRRAAFVGTSEAPFDKWKWKECERFLSSPNLIRLPDGRLIASVGLTGKKSTALCWVDPKTGILTEAAELASTDEHSYSGLALDGDRLWVSHFGSKQGNAGIFVSEFQVPEAADANR